MAGAGILLPEGQHRLYQTDKFSALSEGCIFTWRTKRCSEEAFKLSEDFYNITLASFPHGILARSLFSKHDEGRDTEKLEERKRDLDGFQ